MSRICVASVYLPYDVANMPPTTEFVKVTNYSLSVGMNLVVGCDSNAHHSLWGSSDINKRGMSLLEFLTAQQLEVVNVGTEPTFVNSIRSEAIDITIVSSSYRDRVTNWGVSEEISFSDHRYIVFETENVEPPSVLCRNPKKTNWTQYEAGVAETVLSNTKPYSVDNIETVVCDVTECLISNYHRSCPNVRSPAQKQSPGGTKNFRN